MKILAKIGIVLSVLFIAAGILGMAVTFAGGGRSVDADDRPVYGHGMIRLTSTGNNIDKDEYCPAGDYQNNDFRHHMFNRSNEFDCNEDHDDCPYEEETDFKGRYSDDDFEGCHWD